MNRAVVEKWVAALRSGEFKQGTDRLLTDDGSYCCWGVLCEIHRREFGGTWKGNRDGLDRSYRGEYTAPPKLVQRWLGFAGEPTIRYDDTQTLITELNDCFGLSFTDIADLIEQQWLVQEGANE